MLYLITYSILPGQRESAKARFKQGGGLPPAGVKMVGRWHALDGKGVIVAEADDPVSVGRWVEEWADVMDFQVSPVVRDEQLAQILG